MLAFEIVKKISSNNIWFIWVEMEKILSPLEFEKNSNWIPSKMNII
jgi:hypothetical protein